MYTATIEITKTTPATEVRDRYDNVKSTQARTVDEVARVVVRADTLPALVEKVKAHADLLPPT